MGRKKQYKWPPWKSAAASGIEKRFVQLAGSQLESFRTKGLSGSAFKLYVYMLLESCGKKEFTFPHSTYKELMAKPTFEKAKQELINKGYIEIKQNNANLRKPNVYEFTHKWQL